jgi:hypothetical protein
MTDPVEPILLPPADNVMQEGEWLQASLQQWLDAEFIPESINDAIAHRAAQVFVRQRMEGENEVGALVMAIVTELESFDFSQSFYSEFSVANAIGDMLLDSLGIERCCGRQTTHSPERFHR